MHLSDTSSIDWQYEYWPMVKWMAYVCNVWMEDVCIYGKYGHIYLWCIHMKMTTWIWNDMIKVKGNICMRCINVMYYWKANVCDAYMSCIRMRLICLRKKWKDAYWCYVCLKKYKEDKGTWNVCENVCDMNISVYE